MHTCNKDGKQLAIGVVKKNEKSKHRKKSNAIHIYVAYA